MPRDFIDTMPEFVLATGGRPRVALPSLQWLVATRRNPFSIGALLKNGAVTNSDLTTQDAWYEDAQVRTAYSPADASTTKLRAILNVEAVRVLVSNSVFSALDASIKDDVAGTSTAPGLFMTMDIGGSIKRTDLKLAVVEPPKEFQKTQAAASLADWWLLKGDWVEVGPGSHVLDLEVNTFKLESLNSVAYGADIACWVQVIGHMVPKGTKGALSYLPGAGGVAACGGPVGAVAAPQDIRGIADLPALRAQLAF